MDEDVARIRSELARGRRAAGLSLERIAAASGVSASTVGRIESGAIRCPDLSVVAGIAACVGLDVRLRAYPAGDAVRDVGQQRLLDRLRGVLHADLRWTTEVPLAIDGDLRAWDAVIRGDGWTVAVEAETVLDDLQAVERRLNLKLRDGGIEHLILLVAETRRNRATVHGFPGALPGLGRQARSTLRALRHGVGSRTELDRALVMPCGVTAMHGVRELTAELAARRLQTTIDARAARHGRWTGEIGDVATALRCSDVSSSV